MKFRLTIALAALTTAVLISGTSCQKASTPKQPTVPEIASATASASLTGSYLSNLLAYKSSPHELMLGFYRTYGNHFGSITSLPDSLDIVDLFGSFSSNNFGDSLKSIFVPALHARGIRVTWTGNLSIPTGISHTATGYDSTAQIIMDTINKYNLDGFDIDIESTPSGSDLTDMTGVYTALSKYLGPKSGTTKLLTFDTNQPGSNSLFRKVYPLVSYVLMQTYGQGSSDLQYTWNTFSNYISSAQFIPSFSFYEEYGYPSNIWYDVTYPEDGTGNAYDIARWEPSTGKKGGEFAYAIDRDAPLSSATDNTIYAPNYAVTKQLIQIMNPAADTGIVSGGTYQLVSAVNNSSVLDVYASQTANGAKVELWSKNSPVSKNQEWVVTAVSGGYYTLSPLNAPGQVLDVTAAGTANGTKVEIWAANSGKNQQWQITGVGGGLYSLTPANATATRLAVTGGSATNGTQMEIYSSEGTNSQKWMFVKQ
jgi:Ricin-type beta-trefoil lectin domain-like/Glycosyl hydrolases family 18